MLTAIVRLSLLRKQSANLGLLLLLMLMLLLVYSFCFQLLPLLLHLPYKSLCYFFLFLY